MNERETRGCALHGADCSGRVQLHHVVPRQRLRREWKAAKAAHRRGGPVPWSITRAIADERNLIGLCVWHHGQVEARKLRCLVPASARDFARDYGLEWSIEADERKVVA